MSAMCSAAGWHEDGCRTRLGGGLIAGQDRVALLLSLCSRQNQCQRSLRSRGRHGTGVRGVVTRAIASCFLSERFSRAAALACAGCAMYPIDV